MFVILEIDNIIISYLLNRYQNFLKIKVGKKAITKPRIGLTIK